MLTKNDALNIKYHWPKFWLSMTYETTPSPAYSSWFSIFLFDFLDFDFLDFDFLLLLSRIIFGILFPKVNVTLVVNASRAKYEMNFSV